MTKSFKDGNPFESSYLKTLRADCRGCVNEYECPYSQNIILCEEVKEKLINED